MNIFNVSPHFIDICFLQTIYMVTSQPRYENITFHILWATFNVLVSAGTSKPFVVMFVVRTGLGWFLALSAVAVGSFDLLIKYGQWQNNHILSVVSEWNGNSWMRSSTSVLISRDLCCVERRDHLGKNKGWYRCDIIGWISIVQLFFILP